MAIDHSRVARRDTTTAANQLLINILHMRTADGNNVVTTLCDKSLTTSSHNVIKMKAANRR